MKTRQNKKSKENVAPVEPQSLHIISAGLMNGKWGIVLSNGMALDGVEEIIQTKPAYSDGYTVTFKVFIPVKDEPITKSAIPA